MIKLLFRRFLRALVFALPIMYGFGYAFDGIIKTIANSADSSVTRFAQSMNNETAVFTILAFGLVIFSILFIYGLIIDLKNDLKKSPELKKEIEEFGVIGTINRHAEKVNND